MSGTQFYEYNIKNNFQYCGYDYQEKLFSLSGGINFRWSYIDDTDYTNYSIIALGGYGLGGHYFLIIGVDKSYQ